jgi:transposase
MIDEWTRAEIRRLFFAEHWRVNTIADMLGVHHETVAAAVGTERFAIKPRPVRPTIVDPYKAFIVETLDSYPRLRATRIYEMVKARGYKGSSVQVRRYVRKVRPKPKEAFFRLRTLPGEQAQVDWGSFGKIAVGRARRALSCFVMVLSYSRAMYARFFFDQTQESFLTGHVGAFEALGGVPREVLYDNLKTAVLERRGEHVQFNPALLELCGHYHFAPKPCAPYRGNEKGKVERAIQYLRHAFFAARRFRSIEDLNRQLEGWIQTVAHQRPVPADPDKTRVEDALTAERDRLLPLPAHPFPCEAVRSAKVGKTPYVRYDLNDYSIPHTATQSVVTVIASVDRIRILDAQGEEIAEHERSYDRGKPIEARQHLSELGRAKRRARSLRMRDQLELACPQIPDLLSRIADRNLSLGNEVRRLNSLLERYGPEDFGAAVAEAHSRDAASAASVGHILEQRARAQDAAPTVEVILPDDERVRSLVVQPHALADYDALGAHDQEDDDEQSS